jgi:TrmH family RNA methyltransferase
MSGSGRDASARSRPKHNDLFKDLRRLLHDPAAYRRLGRAWLEAIISAARCWRAGGVRCGRSSPNRAGPTPAHNALATEAPEVVCIPDALMRELSGSIAGADRLPDRRP